MRGIASHEDSDEFDIDEPEEFEESGSDWEPEEEEAGKKRKGRPKAAAPNIFNPFKRKKQEKTQKEAYQFSQDVQLKANGMTSNLSIKAFTNGSFVILKSDMDFTENPPLWKIDGKALLQKYIPITQDGKTLYKNTSTYSGWTQTNQQNYIPASVTYVQQGKKETIVQFNRDKLNIESDKGNIDSRDKKGPPDNSPVSPPANT